MRYSGRNIKDALLVLVAWLMALVIVYLVLAKIKILFN